LTKRFCCGEGVIAVTYFRLAKPKHTGTRSSVLSRELCQRESNEGAVVQKKSPEPDCNGRAQARVPQVVTRKIPLMREGGRCCSDCNGNGGLGNRGLMGKGGDKLSEKKAPTPVRKLEVSPGEGFERLGEKTVGAERKEVVFLVTCLRTLGTFMTAGNTQT